MRRDRYHEGTHGAVYDAWIPRWPERLLRAFFGVRRYW